MKLNIKDNKNIISCFVNIVMQLVKITVSLELYCLCWVYTLALGSVYVTSNICSYCVSDDIKWKARQKYIKIY